MKILTFIISTRNRSATLKKIINQIANLNINIIIVDDNSHSENKNKNYLISKKFKTIKYCFLKKNFGQSYALNVGLKLCRTQ